jgi:hypothetical protein
MLLKGSCHCGGVRFSLCSAHPYPFNHCYCSICRKTSGGGGYAINLGGDFSSLEIKGEDNISVYSATLYDEGSGKSETSSAERNFCKLCGSALWVWDPRWPELIHPHALASIVSCRYHRSAPILWSARKRLGWNCTKVRTTKCSISILTSQLLHGIGDCTSQN